MSFKRGNDLFRLNYLSTLGEDVTYGKRLYIFPPSAAEDTRGSTSVRKQTDGSGDTYKQLSAERNAHEETKSRLQRAEHLHTEQLKEREETITSLQALLQQHKNTILELHERIGGNANANTNTHGEAQRDATQKLLDQITRLQSEKETLLLKVSDYESRTNHTHATTEPSPLYESNQQIGNCWTDSEKELDKIKSQQHDLNRERMQLREENIRLRNHLQRIGEDYSDMTFPANDEKYRESCPALTSPPSPTRNDGGGKRRGGEINQAALQEKDLTISALEDQIRSLNSELEHKTGELEAAEKNLEKLLHEEEKKRDAMMQVLKERLDSELSHFRQAQSNVGQVAMDVQHQFVEVKRAFLELRSEANNMPLLLQPFMAEMEGKMRRAISEVREKSEEISNKYLREMKLRKKLYNQLVELKGNIRVFCRVRPPIKEDGTDDNDIVVTLDPDDSDLVKVNNKGRQQLFDFDAAFDMESSQSQVFDEVSALVRCVLDGYNVCIFAYGQTGAGKTYTMEGPVSDPGINQRALRLLFSEASIGDWEFEILASVMEIYNEVIRDLLNTDPENKMEVRLKPEGGVHVPGLVTVSVTSLDEINEVFATGKKNRATACTNMNEHSSRSHCLLCVEVRGRNTDTGAMCTGRLNLVDLAGSERVSKSLADGTRLKEAQSINKSLACLGDVIHALRNKQGHVPYRNSKLTYLLQDSLGGDSKTLMITHVSPVEKNVCESLCTLTFGQRVRTVELGVASRSVDHGNKTPTSVKRPPNLLISPLPGSPSSSCHSSPVSSPLAFEHSRLTPSSSSPLLGANNSRRMLGSDSSLTPTSPSPLPSSPKTTTKGSSATASRKSHLAPSSLSSPSSSPSASPTFMVHPTASSSQRKLPATSKTSSASSCSSSSSSSSTSPPPTLNGSGSKKMVKSPSAPARAK